MVEASADRHRLVVGFPGSGKTQVLVHRADHLRHRFRVAPDSFRIFLYTNILRDYVRSALNLLDLPPESVCTFDAWCHDFYAANIRRTVPRRSRQGRPDFDAVRKGVLDYFIRHGPPKKPLEFALVDEGQDLPREAYLILRWITRHLTVFADPHQQIFDGGSSLDAIREALEVEGGAVALLGAYRNSPYVARLAARWIDDPAERERYLGQGCTVQKVKELPLLFMAPTFEAELDRLAQVVRGRQALNQRVGVLTAGNRMMEEVASALEARGVEVERAAPPPPAVRASGATWVRFDSITPKVVGLHNAKGLTFDCVLIPGLSREWFDWMPADLRRRLLFTGISRATQWVYLSATEPGALPEMEGLRDCEHEGVLTVQRYAAVLPPAPDTDECSLL